VDLAVGLEEELGFETIGLMAYGAPRAEDGSNIRVHGRRRGAVLVRRKIVRTIRPCSSDRTAHHTLAQRSVRRAATVDRRVRSAGPAPGRDQEKVRSRDGATHESCKRHGQEQGAVDGVRASLRQKTTCPPPASCATLAACTEPP